MPPIRMESQVLPDIATKGAQLGKYSLVAEIARGGMGIIYLAQARGRHGFKKLVVVKELKPELAEDERFREMFLDEARLAARLNHRNIVQTTEVDQDGERYFFVMEYLEGRTLHHVSRLKGDKALSPGTILRIICDMLAGLHYAHELADYDGTPLGVVHRDVSPRNVFLTYDGQVKLLDFGVAKAAGRDQETQAGELKGRVPYMAPEHVSELTIDRRADIFSTGVLLREALTKTRLWGGFSEVEILRELLHKRVPPLPDGLDDEARVILEKALAAEPADRYRTAHEMRTDLERHVSRIDPGGSFAKAGEHISREFASQRAHVKAMIEEHVARAESMPPATGEVLPTLRISSADLPGAPPSDPADGSSVSKPSAPSAPSAPSNPSVPSKASGVSGVVATPRAAAAEPKKKPSARPPIKDISIPPPPPPSKVGSYVLYGVGFVAVVAVLTAAILSTREPPTITKVATDTTSSPTLTGRPTALPIPSASVAPDDTFEVTVRATPPIAEIWIDNVAVGEGPHTARYKAGSRHFIRVESPGYIARTETMDVTATASLSLVLEREAGTATSAPRVPGIARPPAPAPRPTAAPAVPPVAPPAPKPTTTDVTAHPLDTRSPFD